ncbi:hypothetical protein ACGFRG_05790 [Streptomyces sp. NPDC048696]|uniref:hypothetical protein n=1 Tax=Streptomyces sp. NPDC048696 TaxID=3365585 RepID=UPI0037159AC4
MGAQIFYATATGQDILQAFEEARGRARRMHGSGGYSGTITEKDSVTLFKEVGLTEDAAMARADELLLADDPHISDKWGPAGVLPYTAADGTASWLFFGWASS